MAMKFLLLILSLAVLSTSAASITKRNAGSYGFSQPTPAPQASEPQPSSYGYQQTPPQAQPSVQPPQAIPSYQVPQAQPFYQPQTLPLYSQPQFPMYFPQPQAQAFFPQTPIFGFQPNNRGPFAGIPPQLAQALTTFLANPQARNKEPIIAPGYGFGSLMTPSFGSGALDQ